MRRMLSSAFALTVWSAVTPAWADCVSLVKGPIAFDVKSCGVVNPEASFDLKNARYTFIKDLPPADQKKFMDSYRGLILKGRVARSMAIRSGLSPEKGALNGEEVSVYVRPGEAQCNALMGMRVKGVIDEACCEGGGDAPCLLSSALVLKEVKPVGKADSAAGNKERSVAKASPDYVKAEEALRKKDYKEAARFYELVRQEGRLDLTGHYNLGLSYRFLDQCEKAVPVLDWIFKKSSKNEYWTDEEATVRKANFLLARCYAKLNKADYAMVILQSYLLDPQKYRAELKQGLHHKDFGWIKTSKEYQEFQSQAEKALKSLPN